MPSTGSRSASSAVSGGSLPDVGVTVADTLQVGDKVEVRRRFDSQWARGFEIVEVTDGGYRVKRLSDGEVLPVLFEHDDVREARKRANEFWWM
jgi:hypothetical protein